MYFENVQISDDVIENIKDCCHNISAPFDTLKSTLSDLSYIFEYISYLMKRVCELIRDLFMNINSINIQFESNQDVIKSDVKLCVSAPRAPPQCIWNKIELYYFMNFPIILTRLHTVIEAFLLSILWEIIKIIFNF